MNLFNSRKERFSQIKNRKSKETPIKEIPDHVFKTCPSCHENILYSELISNKYVCPVCGSHFKVSARERIRQVCDRDTFVEMEPKVRTQNVYNFEGYDKKLADATMSTGMNEAVICGTGKIDDTDVAIAIMDSRFMMGSMSSLVGEKITRLITYADQCSYPLIISCTSGGARMQEGIRSLVQMAKTSAALKQFSEHGNLYISILTHPTTGGVSASFAMLADITLAEPDALVGFAGRRVIEQTIKETLPPEFQKAEFVLEKGFIDKIVDRRDMKQTLSTLLSLHQGGAHD